MKAKRESHDPQASPAPPGVSKPPAAGLSGPIPPFRRGGVARSPWIVGPLAVAIALLVSLKIGGGAIDVSWADLARWATGRRIDPLESSVLSTVRLPRALMAVLAGAVLSASGAIYQALLRNPLAEPYTLGVSGGATLGAVAAISWSASRSFPAFLAGAPVVSMAALAGASATVAVIHAIARRRDLLSSDSIVLAGVAMNLFFGSLILVVQYFSHHTQTHEMIRWMMGGLDVVGFAPLAFLGPVALAGFVACAASMRDLDPLSLDPLTAAAVGVRVDRVRRRLLVASSAMTGAVVGVAGPIGFVGLIVPHVARTLVGASHARSLPAAAFGGAAFLLACDAISQNLLGVLSPRLANVELPVGVVTALLGGPFFLHLLLRRGREPRAE